MEDIKTLEFNPLIRKSLINYMKVAYEEHAGHPTEHELVTEYNHLKDTNRLHNLYLAEHLTSEVRLRKEFPQHIY